VHVPTVLVISDPPHGSVKEDAAAAIMGLSPDEARHKLAFCAPEILAATNADRAADIAESLIATGMSVRVRDADELGRVPWPRLATAFEFGDGALRVATPTGPVELGYRDPVFAVICRPPVGFPPPAPPGRVAPEGLGASEAMEWLAHVDLYFASGGELARLAVAPELLERLPSSDAAARRATAHTGAAGDLLSSFLAECRRRFARLDVDARLDGVRPRRRFVAGETGFDPDVRKRYAFGTLLLRHLLESISPDLREATHYEMGSRLAYVLRPARGRARVG
jgi:hypothetical protein